MAKKKQDKQTREERKALFDILNEQFDDMPDGAYFEAMAEHGFDIDDILDLSDEPE